jgi:hypothetical protein
MLDYPADTWQPLPMSMSSPTLEFLVQPPTDPDQRYAAAVAKVRALGLQVPPREAWLETFGSAKDDPTYSDAMLLGAEWRAEVNRQSLEQAGPSHVAA